jgi:hypothetical protein
MWTPTQDTLPTHQNIVIYLIILDDRRRLYIRYNPRPHLLVIHDGNPIKSIENKVQQTYNLDIKLGNLIGWDTNSSESASLYYSATLQQDISQQPSSFINWSQILKMSELIEPHWNAINHVYSQWKLNLLMDLDNTLYESLFIRTLEDYEGIPKTIIPDYVGHIGVDYTYIWCRPHLKTSLEYLSKSCHLGLWTAGDELCQKPIADITGISKYMQPHMCHYSNTCICTPNYRYKSFIELNKMIPQPYDLNKTLLIDDSVIHKNNNQYNCTNIKAWKPTKSLIKNGHDNELISLMNYIDKINDRLIHDQLAPIKSNYNSGQGHGDFQVVENRPSPLQMLVSTATAIPLILPHYPQLNPLI